MGVLKEKLPERLSHPKWHLRDVTPSLRRDLMARSTLYKISSLMWQEKAEKNRDKSRGGGKKHFSHTRGLKLQRTNSNQQQHA